MKKTLFISFIMGFLLTQLIHAQAPSLILPENSIVRHFKLEIGYNTTTVLIFSAPVKVADRGKGDREFIIQKQSGLENVLKVKANRKDFTPSNMHVFTTDGRLYAFDISYQDNPLYTTFDLSSLPTASNFTFPNENTKIQLSGSVLDDHQTAETVNKIKTSKPFFSKSSRNYQMKTTLQGIYKVRGLLFFEFKISNRSDLDYPVDFSRLFIHDKQKANKSSIQETEIRPVYKDTLTTIPGHSSIKYVLAVTQFTIPDNKQFTLEIFENNGGRNISLDLKNRHLFRARSL